jgi:hypothetical protein
MTTDFLIVESPAMVFMLAKSEKAKQALRDNGQDPAHPAGTWGAKSDAVVAWVQALGLSFTFGGICDLPD